MTLLPVKNHQMPQPLGLFAGDLFARGTQYLDAAMQLDYQCNKNSLLPGSFLINHSLELFLKSYLVANKIEKVQVRDKYRHYIQRIYRKCVELDLPEVSNLQKLVDNLSLMNREHDFRYPTGYKLTVIEPHAAIEVVQALVNAIGPFIDQARTEASIQFAADTRLLRPGKVEWSD